MIQTFSNQDAYAAAGKPTDESRVALIEDINAVKIDGVNVLTDMPEDGDIVFYDTDDSIFYVKRTTVNKNLINASWTHAGYAFSNNGRQVKVLDKAFPSTTYQWLACWQYAITAISSTSITIKLSMKGDYANYVEIPVTLTSAAINATTVSEINTALEAAGNTGNVGYANHGYWAFLADANGNKVDSDGTQIIIQCDFDGNYQQYNVAGTGCTIALSVWGDMPANSNLYRSTNTSSSSGIMNLAKGMAYYSASGSTPTANVAVGATSIVNLTSFNTSSYCADLRTFYGTYENYIKANKVMWPHPDYGVFSLMDAKEMTRRYANAKFYKKNGDEAWKFPALHYGATVGYGTGKFAVGNWWLSDVTDGTEYMDDTVIAKLQDAQTRMGTTVIANDAPRWFARRYDANNAWFFSGTNGSLSYRNVTNTFSCQAVTLINLK